MKNIKFESIFEANLKDKYLNEKILSAYVLYNNIIIIIKYIKLFYFLVIIPNFFFSILYINEDHLHICISFTPFFSSSANSFKINASNFFCSNIFFASLITSLLLNFRFF